MDKITVYYIVEKLCGLCEITGLVGGWKKLRNKSKNQCHICARISINNNSLKKVLRSLKIKYKTGHSDTNIINVSKTHSVPENYF